jgi:CHASE2 domain-containing sensor protein
MYKTYLGSSGMLFAAWAFQSFFSAGVTESDGMSAILEMMPIWAWGILFTILSIGFISSLAIFSITKRKKDFMNWLSAGAASVCSMWAIGYVLAYWDQGDFAILVPSLFLYSALVHVVVPTLPTTKVSVMGEIQKMMKSEVPK